MKKVFLDTNILLDAALGRQYSKEALTILQIGEDNETHMTEYFAAKVNEKGCLIRLYSITNTIRLCQTSHSRRLYRAVAV